MALFLFTLLNLFSVSSSSLLQRVWSSSWTIHSHVWNRVSFLWRLQFSLTSHLLQLVPLWPMFCPSLQFLCVQKTPVAVLLRPISLQSRAALGRVRCSQWASLGSYGQVDTASATFSDLLGPKPHTCASSSLPALLCTQSRSLRTKLLTQGKGIFTS